MKHAERLRRLEAQEQGRAVYRRLEWIAERHGRSVDELLHRAEEIGRRIKRFGMDAEVRRLAREYGKSEDEVRAELDAVIEEWK